MNTRTSDSNSQDIIVITGGSGLIGQNLAKQFAKEFQVVALDIKKPNRPIQNVSFIEMNIAENESVTKALTQLKQNFGNRIASVIHLAAFYSFDLEESELYDKITVRGTERLLNGLQDFEVEQFIFSSTMLVHAPGIKGQSMDETWPVDAKWAYPQSKVAAEKVIETTRGKIPSLILRIAGVYDDRCHSIPIANQIERINEHHFTSHLYPGDKSHGQSFIHMEDLVSAISAAVDKRKVLPEGEVLLLGEPEAMSYEDLQNTIAELIHDHKWITQRIPAPLATMGAMVQEHVPFIQKPFIKHWMVKLADDHYEVDISRARKFLGWGPKHSLRETLPLMINFLKSEPDKFYEENKISKPIKAAVNLRKTFPAILSVGALSVITQALLRRKVWR